MATMIPDAINPGSPSGERQFFIFLKNTLEHHPNIIVWHRIHIGSGTSKRECDFVIYIPNRGILICEVKDWDIDAIQEAGPDRWLVDGQNKINPYEQARQCMYTLK